MKKQKETKKLNAKNLKSILWDTLTKLEEGTMDVATADAIASQSREIVRVINSQQSILRQAHRDVTADLLSYATGLNDDGPQET